MDIKTKEAQPSPEQMKLYMKQWEKWINDIASQNKLVEGGNHLSTEGRVIRPKNVITTGPYVVNKESVAGYIIILAKNFDEAIKIAKDCPILLGEGTSVEVRKVASI
jgi:hypothetical protein